jgi:hypothetical protein
MIVSSNVLKSVHTFKGTVVCTIHALLIHAANYAVQSVIYCKLYSLICVHYTRMMRCITIVCITVCYNVVHTTIDTNLFFSCYQWRHCVIQVVKPSAYILTTCLRHLQQPALHYSLQSLTISIDLLHVYFGIIGTMKARHCTES